MVIRFRVFGKVGLSSERSGERFKTQKFLWIVTADIKDLHVPKGRRFVPLLEILSDLVETGVSVQG